jgi:hypothetical protein
MALKEGETTGKRKKVKKEMLASVRGREGK